MTTSTHRSKYLQYLTLNSRSSKPSRIGIPATDCNFPLQDLNHQLACRVSVDPAQRFVSLAGEAVMSRIAAQLFYGFAETTSSKTFRHFFPSSRTIFESITLSLRFSGKGNSDMFVGVKPRFAKID